MSNSPELVRESLVSLFDRFMAATQATPTSASKRFAADGSFYKRLQEGVNRPTQRKADKIVQAFSDAWPANAAWPLALVARPAPAPGGAGRV